MTVSRTDRVLRALAAGLLLITASGTARADCVDGVREASAGERAFHQRALAAMAAALPGPTADTQLRGRPHDFRAPVRPPSFCRGQPEGAFDLAVVGAYLYTFPKAEYDRIAAERQALRRRIEALEALPPERVAERTALENQARAAYEGLPRRNRSDPPFTAEQQALYERLTEEARVFEQRARAVNTAHAQSMKPQTDPLRAEADRLVNSPQSLDVRIVMNVVRPPAAGVTPQADVRAWGGPAPARSAGLTVQNVAVGVVGPDGPARKALAEAVDAAWLQALVGRPLPDVTASEAQAARLAALAPAPVAIPAPAGGTPTAGAVPSAAGAAGASGSAAVAPAGPAAPAAASDASTTPAPVAAPAPASAPVAAPASAPVAAPAPVAASAPVPADCPPRTSAAAGQAASAGAALGGAVLGGGFGRSLGNMIGGAVGAVTPQAPAPPGCPR